MGFFDFFKSGNKQEQDRARDALVDLDIDTAIAAHENWKVRLRTFLDGNSTEDLRADVICRDDRCDLGKWIHGPGGEKLRHYAAFGELKATHRLFHMQASSVIMQAKSGSRDAAEKLLQEDYSRTSASIIRGLNDLKLLSTPR